MGYRVLGEPKRTATMRVASLLVQMDEDPAKGKGAVKEVTGEPGAAVSENQENTDFLK